MGPMFVAPLVILFILLVRLMLPLLVFGGIAFLLWSAVAGRGRLHPRQSWEGTLRARYARGEIGRQQYLDALSDILKERYIRGELTLDEYEARLELLLSEPTRGTRRGLGPWPQSLGPGGWL